MTRPLDIKILSLNECTDFVKTKSNFNIVSIRSTYRTPKEIYEIIDDKKDNYDSIIIESFDDVERREPMYVEPKLEQIERILNWSSKIGNNFAVHCTAGASRSSSIAYLIACQKMDPKEAVKILDFWIHTPNQLIIKLGEQVLGNDKLLKVMLNAAHEHYKLYKTEWDDKFAKMSAFIVC